MENEGLCIETESPLLERSPDDFAFDESSWFKELEEALESDSASILKLSYRKELPHQFHVRIWDHHLRFNGDDNLENFKEIYDLPNQQKLREDCQQLVGNLGNEEGDKVSVLSDVESVLTHFCKVRSYEYLGDNGWISILQTLVALRLPKNVLYTYFSTICDTFLSRYWMQKKNDCTYSVFHLLLMYHDPELCSFLDTKRVTPDLYASCWFKTLFAGICSFPITLALWDAYFSLQDAFLIFFMALVIVVNAREQILSLKDAEQQKIASSIEYVPAVLELDDLQDFISLAIHYSSETPASFAKVFRCLYTPIMLKDYDEVKNMLCLPVLIEDLLENKSSVHYFVVDCRPADQYNAGHLNTAFHLDATLMLQEPSAFSTAVQALLAAQHQALALSSTAAGEHLCFMGSGQEQEDKYVHMVISFFLQKFCNAMRSKSAFMRHKLADLIAASSLTTIATGSTDHHVSKKDRSGHCYRGVTNVFSINDENDRHYTENSDNEQHDLVSLETWLKKPDVVASFECKLVCKDKSIQDGNVPDKKGMAYIVARRSLTSIVRITSRKRFPELITFRYEPWSKLLTQTPEDVDRLIIPQAGEAVKLVKQHIVRLADSITVNESHLL